MSQASRMIGMLEIQSGLSALNLGTSQNTGTVDNLEQNVNDESSNIVNKTPSSAPSQESVPIEDQVNNVVIVAPDQKSVTIIINAKSCGFQTS